MRLADLGGAILGLVLAGIVGWLLFAQRGLPKKLALREKWEDDNPGEKESDWLRNPDWWKRQT